MYKKGLHTDFMLLRPFSDITEHDDYMRVVSHGFPNYYFGNTLVLRHPPQERLYQKCGFVRSHDIFSLFRGPKDGT